MSPKGDRGDDAGFAGRWSKLKQEVRKPTPPLEKEPEAAPPAGAEVASDEPTDEEILESLGLPDPDTLKRGDDFSAFMSKAVPARLRSRALRKLWISDPVLANLDELVDYGQDFTDAATVIENLTTGYQVGKGWADKLIETPKPLTAAKQDNEEPPRTDTEDAVADASPETKEREIPAPESVENKVRPEGERLSEAPAAPQHFPARRRMRFRVAED